MAIAAFTRTYESHVDSHFLHGICQVVKLTQVLSFN